MYFQVDLKKTSKTYVPKVIFSKEKFCLFPPKTWGGFFFFFSPSVNVTNFNKFSKFSMSKNWKEKKIPVHNRTQSRHYEHLAHLLGQINLHSLWPFRICQSPLFWLEWPIIPCHMYGIAKGRLLPLASTYSWYRYSQKL